MGEFNCFLVSLVKGKEGFDESPFDHVDFQVEFFDSQKTDQIATKAQDLVSDGAEGIVKDQRVEEFPSHFSSVDSEMSAWGLGFVHHELDDVYKDLDVCHSIIKLMGH